MLATDLPIDVPAIDPTLSVNELLTRYPAAIRVLNAFGVDTCCGGAMRIDAAVRETGVPVDDILSAVREAVANAAPRAPR